MKNLQEEIRTLEEKERAMVAENARLLDALQVAKQKEKSFYTDIERCQSVIMANGEKEKSLKIELSRLQQLSQASKGVLLLCSRSKVLTYFTDKLKAVKEEAKTELATLKREILALEEQKNSMHHVLTRAIVNLSRRIAGGQI